MKKTVFTNGCFDIIHAGHVDLLERAKMLGTYLVVGINSDQSVKKIKGNDRPFVNQFERKAVLLGLRSVDEVHIFDEPTPEKLIEEIKPDVLVKGGDWKLNEIIGAEFVKESGGKVFSLPLKGGLSSSVIVDKIRKSESEQRFDADFSDTKSGGLTEGFLAQQIEVFRALYSNQISIIDDCAEIICDTLINGGKILTCGNGENAAVARYISDLFAEGGKTGRQAYPVTALTATASDVAASSGKNDLQNAFSRQIEALADKGDCLIAISTSGSSENMVETVMKARSLKCRVVGMTGAKGKKLASLCDASVLVPSERTVHIREIHIAIAHIWREIFNYRIGSDSR